MCLLNCPSRVGSPTIDAGIIGCLYYNTWLHDYIIIKLCAWDICNRLYTALLLCAWHGNAYVYMHCHAKQPVNESTAGADASVEALIKQLPGLLIVSFNSYRASG